MSDSTADEIDLGIVFHKIKEVFTNFFISIYYGIEFVKRNWWKILIIALIGGVLGYYLNYSKNYSKTSTIIVQNNFNSSSYVYEAIEQLNIKSKDSIYLIENGFNPSGVIKKIEIEPIVNILEILEKTKYSFRAMEPLLEKADFEDELLTSEVFNTDYSYHRITVVTNHLGSKKTIENILAYLNNNPKVNEIKKVVIEDTKSHIKEIDITINGINNVMDAFSEKPENLSKASQIYISTGSVVTDLGVLVEKKGSYLKERRILKTELMKYDDIVSVLNKPVLYKKTSIITINMKSMAIIFVLLFLLAAFIYSKYQKIKKIAENKLSE